jgi:adenylate kinase family enzyme
MIIGAVGTGKSTLGTALGRLLGLPVVHLDQITWQLGCTVIPDAEFMAVHDALMAREAWIIEGTGHWESWADRASAADTIVLTDYGVWQAWRWVLKRQACVLLRLRPAYPEGCPALDMTWQLLRWAWIYRREMRAAIEGIVEGQAQAGKTILRLRTPAMTKRFLRAMGESA